MESITNMVIMGYHDGLTSPQRTAFRRLLGRFIAKEVHLGAHGDGDQQMLGTISEVEYEVEAIVAHPAEDDGYRLDSIIEECSRKMPTTSSENRRKNMVRIADVVIACPYSPTYRPDDEAWLLLEEASKASKPRYWINSNGNVESGVAVDKALKAYKTASAKGSS